MNKCSRCQASVPSGRNYCTAHYMEVLADYENAMTAYHNDMSVWNSMSSEAQAAAHVSAEESTIGGYAGIVGFIVGASAWYILAQSQPIDAVFGIGLLVACVAAFTVIRPIRVLIGRIARLFVHAIGYFITLWIIGAIISIWSPLIKDNASLLSIGLMVVVTAIAVVLEASGGHHASGMPTMPSKPSP
jgi:hypothetical protein